MIDQHPTQRGHDQGCNVRRGHGPPTFDLDLLHRTTDRVFFEETKGVQKIVQIFRGNVQVGPGDARLQKRKDIDEGYPRRGVQFVAYFLTDQSVWELVQGHHCCCWALQF